MMRSIMYVVSYIVDKTREGIFYDDYLIKAEIWIEAIELK